MTRRRQVRQTQTVSRPQLFHSGLLKVLLTDFRQFRGLLCWALLALVSALVTVYLTHQHRELMVEREQLLQERDELDVEWRHLVVEQTALTEHSRIEELARRELGMQRPDEAQEVLVPWR